MTTSIFLNSTWPIETLTTKLAAMLFWAFSIRASSIWYIDSLNHEGFHVNAVAA